MILATLHAVKSRPLFTPGFFVPKKSPDVHPSEETERRHCERSHGTVSRMEVSLGQMEGEGGEHNGRHPL